MSSLQKNIMKSRLPPMMPSSAAGRNSRLMAGNPRQRAKSYVPKMWDEFFAQKLDVAVDETHIFRVYLSAAPVEDGPLLVLLHGGGYSALTWSHFTTEITQTIHCQCLAIDLRGHGDSVVQDEDDLSAETLANDVAKVLNQLYADGASRPIMLVGHSMGGAICVHIAAMELLPALIGCVVIDVVEGTAMESLASMQNFLRSRPKTFRSIPQAIEWSVRGGQIRNADSAAVSMPGQIVNMKTGKLAVNELPLPPATTATASATPTIFSNPNAIAEHADDDDDEEEDNRSSNNTVPPLKAARTEAQSTPSAAPHDDASTATTTTYTWRIDLTKTEHFWAGWFEGLSQKFLDLRVPKLLLLANIDGLDRALTVGQMQGKFQLQVLARSGHVVHEDQPHQVAEIVAAYMVRNRFAQASGDFLPGATPAC